MEDIKITCENKECGKVFVWPVHEQKWFESKGFTPPKRCKECRAKRRAEKESREVKKDPVAVGDADKNYQVKCVVCDGSPTVGQSGLCGPCCWGEADTIGGNW